MVAVSHNCMQHMHGLQLDSDDQLVGMHKQNVADALSINTGLPLYAKQG